MSEFKSILCQFSKGMFSDEVVVLLQVMGKEISYFVPKDALKPESADRGKLKVEILRGERQSWAVIPNELRTTIPVTDRDLVEA